MSYPSIAHVPTALTMQSDTLVTVATQLSAAWTQVGGKSVVVLATDRDLHVPDAENRYVNYTRYCPRTYFNRRELAVDVLCGNLGARRPFYGRMWRPAVEAIERDPVDAVLLYEGHYAAPSLPMWRKLGSTRVFLYVHNPLSRTYRQRELQRLLGNCEGVIFCSDHLREAAAERLGAVDVPLYVVHNGVDPRFLDLAQASGPVAPGPADPFEVVFVGRVVPEKAPHLLLDALIEAQRVMARPLRARIVGSSSYRSTDALSSYEQQLRTTVAAHSLDVDFVPFVDKDELARLYRGASAVCLPSAWAEGLPLVALEAMACGAPIISSTSPGLVEACGDVALYAPMGDSTGLAEGIVRLAGDEEERTRRSDAAWQRARQFTWPAAAQALMAIVGRAER